MRWRCRVNHELTAVKRRGPDMRAVYVPAGGSRTVDCADCLPSSVYDVHMRLRARAISAASLGFAFTLVLIPSLALSEAACSFTSDRTLKVGSRGDDVLSLQKVLNMSDDTRVALTGAGSLGMETNVFG